ncbi:alpha/beta-gliadin clone PW1215 [Fopius arisanus]|uniref:Alpha/beta-gliadin clone PW1215 n=2 Tax=Fopius arisanus TaxID=64838 RepID=A0A9R1TKQ0_9HYME|nr:PREDICTED: alpha/beta-gliadin clone PW1215-like [Fopius arisanus]
MNILSTFILAFVLIVAKASEDTHGYGHGYSHGFTGHKLISQSVHLKEIPTKVVKITKTIAVKVPVPYPVKVPVHIPVPVPVNHPFPIPVPQIVKVPEHVPYEVSKHIPVELTQQVPLLLTKPVPYPQPYPVPHGIKISQPLPYPVPHPISFPAHEESKQSELNHVDGESQHEESSNYQQTVSHGDEAEDKPFNPSQPIVVQPHE